MAMFSKDFLQAWSVGLNFVVFIFVGLAIGYFLDNTFKVTAPWLTMIFLIIGIIGGFRELWRFAKREENGADKENK